MHRALVLVVGLVLALGVAAAVAAPPLLGSSGGASRQAVENRTAWRAAPVEPAPQRRAAAASQPHGDALVAAGVGAWSAGRWAGGAAAIVAAGVAGAALVWSLARHRRGGFAAHAAQIGARTATPAPAPAPLTAPQAPAGGPQAPAAAHSEQSAAPARPAWLRSDAGDVRAAAALGAVDEALVSGGWRSRAVLAATEPDARCSEVRVALLLHPAERSALAALAGRIRAAHPSWTVAVDGRRLVLELGPAPLPPLEALLLPVLQTGDHAARTHYLCAASTRGLTVCGPRAAEALHGLLADIVCMYPPSRLGLTLLGKAEGALYRAAPQWDEPPADVPRALECLAEALASADFDAALRPLLLVAWEPDDTLLHALLGLEQRLRALRTPPVALLIAAEQPGALLRDAALPALTLPVTLERGAAELRLGELSVAGQAPSFGADDMRELLRWLPRFGSAPPRTAWVTIEAHE